MAADQPTDTLRKIDDDDDAVFAARMKHYDDYFNREDAGQKLGREIYIIGGGTFDAAKNAFSKEHIAETGLTAAGSLAIGFAVRAAEANIPALRPAIAVAGLAMTYSLVRDTAGKGGEIGAIIGDTWQHKEHDEQNRKAFSVDGGKFIFDAALTTGGALAGATIGNKMLFGPGSNYARIATYDGPGLLGRRGTPHERLYSKDNPIAQMFENTRVSILELKTTGAKQGSRYSSNAFLIGEDGTAVTNCHCVHDVKSLTLFDHLGRRHTADVLATDAPKDVAILKLRPIENGTEMPKFKPLKLAAADAQPGDRLAVVSKHFQQKDLTLSPGRAFDFKSFPLSPEMRLRDSSAKAVKGIKITVDPFNRQVVYKPEPRDWSRLVPAQRMLSNYFSKKGISGSPVLSMDGEVVGVHTGNFGPLWSQLTGRNASSPVSAIAEVLAEAQAKK